MASALYAKATGPLLAVMTCARDSNAGAHVTDGRLARVIDVERGRFDQHSRRKALHVAQYAGNCRHVARSPHWLAESVEVQAVGIEGQAAAPSSRRDNQWLHARLRQRAARLVQQTHEPLRHMTVSE
jgi:hypothetical protein